MPRLVRMLVGALALTTALVAAPAAAAAPEVPERWQGQGAVTSWIDLLLEEVATSRMAPPRAARARSR